MKSFEYAAPTTEAEAVELLSAGPNTAILAGGTDLVSLMKRNVVEPDRVVDVKRIESLRNIEPADGGVLIGAAATLEEMADSPYLADYRSLFDVNDGIRAIQMQSNGTLGGDLCHLPLCWYYRNGYGLFGDRDGQPLPAAGDNRYHAVLGNTGRAKFVSATRFAPALMAWGAQVRVVGPQVDGQPASEQFVPLENFYVTPRSPEQGITVLRPGQLLTHIWLPPAAATQSASYEVLETQGLDRPLAACSVCVDFDASRQHVRRARVVLGHVAPTPWVATKVEKFLVGKSINSATADQAGSLVAEAATPLAHNEYKVQLAKTAVKRALLRACGQLEGVL